MGPGPKSDNFYPYYQIWEFSLDNRVKQWYNHSMNKNNLLTNRKYLIDQGSPEHKYINWYSALHFLENYKSVIKTEWTNTCSSAGDWDGYLVQHIGNCNFLIAIFQENNYPRFGYTLYTGDLLASWKGEFKDDDAFSIYLEYMEYGY